MQHLPSLPERMLEKLTRLDPRRELALVALDPGDNDNFISVGRFAPNRDGKTAEFALTVADAWQHQGIGRILLERLCDAARAMGYEALVGYVLAENRDMLELVTRLGFHPSDRDGAALTLVRSLK
jgi:acetyltransferase